MEKLEKFPDFIDAPSSILSRSPSPLRAAPGFHSSPGARATERWMPATRTEANSGWSPAGRGHGRQKSLGDAIRNIRTRNGSVGQNAQEIAEALKAPISPALIVRLPCFFSSPSC